MRGKALIAIAVAMLSMTACVAAWAQTAPAASVQNPPPGTSAEPGEPPQPMAWSSLSPAQQRVLEPLQGQWNQLRPGHQRHLARHAERWATLPPERQQQIRERLTRWANMTPEQRQRWRENARAFHDLTPAERARVSAAFRRFQSLPPAERRALHERWRAMSPEQRMQWMTDHAGKPIPMHPPASGAH